MSESRCLARVGTRTTRHTSYHFGAMATATLRHLTGSWDWLINERFHIHGTQPATTSICLITFLCIIWGRPFLLRWVEDAPTLNSSCLVIIRSADSLSFVNFCPHFPVLEVWGCPQFSTVLGISKWCREIIDECIRWGFGGLVIVMTWISSLFLCSVGRI